jgi:putative transposase
VWSGDFVSARMMDELCGFNLIDEHTRECLLIRAGRRRTSAKVIEALVDVMVRKGVPEHLRSDNGPEFVAKDLRHWLASTGAKTLHIEPGLSTIPISGVFALAWRPDRSAYGSASISA